MLKAYKYRLYPNKEQKIYFSKCFGSVRFIYNKMLNDKIEYYKETNKMLNNTPAQYKKEYQPMNKTNMLKDTIKVYKSQKTIYPNPLPV